MKTKTQKRRPGRPRKFGQGRINATVRFTPERHRMLKKAADADGRSVSEEVERLVERALQYDQMLEAMRTTPAEIERGNLWAALHRQGYVPLHTMHGDVWLPPGYPGERSGFIKSEGENQ